MSDPDKRHTVELRFRYDDPVMQRRDHHVMHFLRAQADDTDLGCITVRVPALDRLWELAYAYGFECGAAVKSAAAEGKKKIKSASPKNSEEIR